MKMLVFDPALRRPGCVLLQAAAGGDIALAREFPAETWLIAPTPGMGLYEVTDEMVPKLIEMSKRAINKETDRG